MNLTEITSGQKRIQSAISGKVWWVGGYKLAFKKHLSEKDVFGVGKTKGKSV